MSTSSLSSFLPANKPPRASPFDHHHRMQAVTKASLVTAIILLGCAPTVMCGVVSANTIVDSLHVGRRAARLRATIMADLKNDIASVQQSHLLIKNQKADNRVLLQSTIKLEAAGAQRHASATLTFPTSDCSGLPWTTGESD